MTMNITDLQFRGCSIPADMAPSLEAWIQNGEMPGSFLSAVLCNDLLNAVGHADAVNLPALPAYVGYLYNEAPGPCWGSPEKVAAWAAKFQTNRSDHG